jgi:hypothetical protein
MNLQVLDDVKIKKATGAKLITMEYAHTNLDDVLAEIAVITRDASLKILDAHNKAMLEYEIDAIANKIRSDIGDNIAFEMFMGGLYSEFNTNPSPNIAEIIIGKLHTSKYYKNPGDLANPQKDHISTSAYSTVHGKPARRLWNMAIPK